MEPVENLIQWFIAKGGSIDRSAIGFKEFPDSGRGAVALRDIDEGHTLFTIPRSLILSIRTCSLKEELGEKAWEELGAGWTALILCMMWEQMKGEHSDWSSYIACLPSTFVTPMFWDESDLKELQATAVANKIGKDDAESEYRSRIVPLLSTRPDLFPTEHHRTIFSVENFHRLGSSILSRSFHVEEWKDPSKADESFDSNNSDDDEEDTGDVAMVPMADMLNALVEHDNARLFYEELAVSMVTTKAIKVGDQIWNTYGDPPNSDLLRRYGHVDLLPLPDGSMGNPADVVEIRADLAVQVCSGASDLQERIDWWLEQGGEDVFVIEASEPEVPEGLISILKLLRMSEEEWAKTKLKSKPPKPSLDFPSAAAASSLLESRLAEYPTTFDEDETLLANPETLSINKRNALVVRLGEKRILHKVLNTLMETLPTLANSDKKRGRTSDEASTQKKARR